jgi:hypothetical protein
MEPYKVFVSHGSHDHWLAGQLSKEIQGVGASPFLDETNIPKGSPDFKKIIREQISDSRELIALFTPWSALRSWVWIEMGAAWNREIPILAVFHGMEANDLDKTGQGKAILEDINIISLNEFDTYVRQLGARIDEARR